MAQYLRALAAESDDLSSISGTHMGESERTLESCSPTQPSHACLKHLETSGDLFCPHIKKEVSLEYSQELCDGFMIRSEWRCLWTFQLPGEALWFY